MSIKTKTHPAVGQMMWNEETDKSETNRTKRGRRDKTPLSSCLSLSLSLSLLRSVVSLIIYRTLYLTSKHVFGFFEVF